MIDEFDLIDKDLYIYRAFSPANFRSRVAFAQKTLDTTWSIRVTRGKVTREGGLADHDRAKGVVALMKRFAHHVPDLVVVHNGHDGARIPLAWEERNRLNLLVKAGQCKSRAISFSPSLLA